MNYNQNSTPPDAHQFVHQIALNSVPGVGPLVAKKLIAYCGSAEAVFAGTDEELQKIPGVGPRLLQALRNPDCLKKAEAEIEFIEQHRLRVVSYLAPDYPARLKECPDAPVLLYVKGDVELHQQKVVSIVGTRSATEEGRQFTRQLIHDLAPHQPLIVSGLAYGIDIVAHRTALELGLPTAAVLGHSLDRIYPWQHRKTAAEIARSGALISEYETGTKPDRMNFPQRNRIVAGLADAVVVVQSNASGGSMITAQLANDYNREVFAVPGRVGDPTAEGCNRLIKTHRAALLESVADLEYVLGWQKSEAAVSTPNAEPQGLEGVARRLWHFLSQHGESNVDTVCMSLGLPSTEAANALLELEFDGYIKSRPGNRYRLI